MRRKQRTAGLLAPLICGALLLAACGGGAAEPADGAQGDHATVRVGVLPLAAVAPVHLGIDKGFFAEENLTVEPQIAQGGAAIVPAVMAGDLQFGYSNNVSLLLATAKDLPLQIVTEGNQAVDNPDDATDAVVVPRGQIDGPEDLEGKTIGVNTLKNIGEVVIKGALEKRGVDVSALEFVEIPFPEMVGAVQDGRVDAGWVVEPFLQQAKDADMQVIANPFFETTHRLSIGTYFTTDQYAAENPEVVERFMRAMKRSLEYTQSHPEELRSTVADYTEIPPEVVEEMRLPYFSSELNTESIELLSEHSAKYGLVDSEPDLNKLLPDAT